MWRTSKHLTKQNQSVNIFSIHKVTSQHKIRNERSIKLGEERKVKNELGNSDGSD